MLYKHQKKYADGYQDKELVVHEGGLGKTICACVWLRDGRDDDALVVCPKRVKMKWQKALSDWGTKAMVLTKEEFKKFPNLRDWSAIVIDEADEFASPLFGKGRSQLSTTLYILVRAKPKVPILLLTATPIRSTPWNLHTLLCFRGVYIDWKEWRNMFFSLERRPFLPRPAWLPKKDWRTTIRPVLEKYSDIVLLRDVVDAPPVSEKETITDPESMITAERKWEATASFVEEHRHEQTNKAKTIIEFGKEYRKVLVVAYYIEQVKELEKELSKDRETFVIYGKVKDQEAIIAQATASDECYFIVQASLGAGFDADTFSCVVFASMSYKVRDYVQMKYRVRRIHNLHPVEYIYLLGGKCDRQVLETIRLGKDFIPSEWET